MVRSVAALLSLLGAAALAGVRSAPVEKEDHVEEMLTQCIVEVLLNGLSKASAPPINPQCKELLKKSNRQKQEEQNVGQSLELDTRHLLGSEELGKPPEGTVREEQDLNEEEFKRGAEGGEKWHLEGGKQAENGHLQGISHSFDESRKEEKESGGDKRAEDGSHKRINHSEEESKAKKHNEEAEHELLDKKSLPTTGKVDEEDYKRSGGQRYLEEIGHSEEKGNEESKEEEEEDEEESSEKYHHSFHREYEDSSEKGEDDIEKRGRKPRHYHQKSRLGTSEYKRQHNREKKASPEESSEEESEFWDKRSHYPKHYFKTGHHSEEKRNSDEMPGSEEMEEKKGSREYQDRWPHSREDNEEEGTRHHSREHEEKRHHYERKRLFDEPHGEVRYYYEERTPHSKGSEEDEGKPHGYDSRDEKRPQHDKEPQRSQLEERPRQQNIEKEEGEQRLYNPEEHLREEKRHGGHASEGELEKRHYYNEREKHVGNKRTLLMEEGYPRSHYLVENVKRAVPPYIPYYQQLRWKSRHPEKKDEATDPFLESEEEPKSRPSEGDFFPEYIDYDLWEKKPLMDGLNHKSNGNNHLEKNHKLDGKRQYNRMDELAHLLSYRKKSAEFPELYSSKEDVKRGHIVRNGEGKLNQRPLTPEEEKELEDLAAMDLELQKIAEKFNNNRRG